MDIKLPKEFEIIIPDFLFEEIEQLNSWLCFITSEKWEIDGTVLLLVKHAMGIDNHQYFDILQSFFASKPYSLDEVCLQIIQTAHNKVELFTK